MIDMLPQALGVFVAQGVLYVLLPLWGLRLSVRVPADWVRAAIAGWTAQATLGMVLSWVLRAGQEIAPFAYASIWILARMVLRRRGGRAVEAVLDPLLLALLAIAAAVRLIHPLSTWALGQSDAYTHLMFLQDVIYGGRLSNPIYPPGFAWILALPCLAFGLDPYIVARFGGAFHGAALVLTIYVMLREWRGPNAARAAAAVTTGFPLAELLIKTGVGTFANQMGLLTLPAAWWAASRWWSGGARGADAAVLMAALILLGVATPMMLMQFGLLLSLAGLAILARERTRSAWTPAWRAALLALPALLLFAAHLYQAGGVARGQTSAYMIGVEVSGPIDIDKAEPGMDIKRDQLVDMLADFVSIKRWGFGSWFIDLPAIILIAAFSVLAAYGLGWRERPAAFIGIWGSVTTLQVISGIFQFSSYQREGWSLMIAAISLGGWMVQSIADRLKPCVPERALSILCIAAAAAGLVWPPSHRVFASPAEDEMIAFLRALSGDARARRKWPELRNEWHAIDQADRISIVARPISGFSNRIGDPVHALARGRLFALDRAVAPVRGEYIIGLLDAYDAAQPPSIHLMRLLQPRLVAEFEKRRQEADRASAEIEAGLRALGMETKEIVLSPRLRALIVAPRDSEFGGERRRR
jgi:hypothetical protein